MFLKKKILRIEEVLEHVSTVWIFNLRIYHMLFFVVKKWPISTYPLVEIEDFLKVPYLVWA
jgi:hypothetical protein